MLKQLHHALYADHEIQKPSPVKYAQSAFLSLRRREDNTYDGVYREFEPKNSATKSDIRYQRYSPDFQCIGHSYKLAEGEDPRLVKIDGRLYAQAVLFRNNSHLQQLIDIQTGHVRIINHWLHFAGKNWTYVESSYQSKVTFVRSIDPLCTLELDTNSFSADVVIPEASPANYIGPYRGGTPATAFGENERLVTGMGHKTVESPILTHIPFCYTIDLFSKTLSIDELQPIGFKETDKLIDPTSTIDSGTVVVTCSQQSWWHDQEITFRTAKVVGTIF